MKKIICLVLVFAMSLSMSACFIVKKTDRQAPGIILEDPEIRKNDAYGDFGKIQKNVDGEWIDLNGDEEKRSLRPSIDEDAQDEEVRWGDFVDWIRRSNQD